MASLIKNQILKHLSKFTKNLSPDKLQLSAIKGSCEVNNIELNEEILMQLLELPAWMSLTRAYCNYASIKIQWMKLKTIPIYLLLDEVIIDVETCENFRDSNGSYTFSSNSPYNQQQDSGSYGFTQKVIDGITLSINSVMIQFNSKIFSASFELTRINVESRNCLWKKVDDLSKTRIRDSMRGQVLIFKHIEWQTLRFVAKSEAKAAIGQAPLRLIANQASCRITLKKRLADCAVLAARIMFIFDDLLWVLTDSQLLSALHFADYLGDLIKKAPITKKFDNNEQKNNGQLKPKVNLNSSQNNLKATNLSSSISLLFSQHDVKETSHHIIIRRIEVHLMDDLGPHSERSQCPDLKDGGALQISFHKLFIDLYPYHRIDGGNDDRTHWFRYNDPSPLRKSFILHKLNSFFKKQQIKLKNEGSKFDIESIKSHLISQVVVIRLTDYSIGCVSTNRNSRDKNDPELSKLIFFDNSAALPGNVPPVYIELNSYFFCEPFDKLNFRIPEDNIFAFVAPVKICFEPLTILWINSFFANLRNALMKLQEAFQMPNDRSQNKPNIRAEVLMPTIVLRLNDKNDFDFGYDSIELKISKIVLYNCDAFISKEYFRNLDNLMKQFSSNIDFFYEHSKYPWLKSDMMPISPEFIHKINRLFLNDSSKLTIGNENEFENLEIDFLAIHVEPLWIEIKSSKNSTSESLLEPINLTLWVNEKTESFKSDLDLNIFARVADPIKGQITHNQFLFLIRLIDMIGDFTGNLNYDTYMIQRSQHKKHSEQNFDPKIVHKYLLDLEDKIIKTIFKSTSFVSHIPEVNIFLILKQEFVDEALSSSNNSQCPSTLETLSNELNECKISSEDSDFEKNDLQKIVKLEEVKNPKPEETVIIHVNHLGNPLLMNNRESIFSLPKSPSDMNGENFRHSTEKPIQPQLLKKHSLSSFDTSSIKIHYTLENDDAVSTISDFSADDSDQQSMIALINEEVDVFDEIIADNSIVEEAVDIVENLESIENNNNDALSDFSLDNKTKVRNENKTCYIDVLHIQMQNIDLIQQSSKGFLSQVFVNGMLSGLVEYKKLQKTSYLDLLKRPKPVESTKESKNEIALRIDSFNKGTLKDELISVYVNDLNQSLNKETIDLVVDFFNDNITEKVAPMAILVKNVQFKIIDNSLRIPPMIFNVPKLAMNRNKENKWLIELDNPLLRKNLPATNLLLFQHLKIFERNLIFDVVDLIKEQDRLNEIKTTGADDPCQNDTQEILNQVLNQKELLLAEIDLLRKENATLRSITEKNL